MTHNEFHRPVAVDFAPRGSHCAWCGKPAERQLTAIGGSYHNESGLFCQPCGEKFSQVVHNALEVARKPATEVVNSVKSEQVLGPRVSNSTRNS